MATQAVQFSSLISRDAFQSGILSDQSKIDLKDYFISVKTRFESGEEFPYSIDELVPTVFSRKAEAIEALKRDFTQDIDFRVICCETKDDTAFGGVRKVNEFYLTPLAFEFMVARKNKDIFSLYHTVFHLKTTPSTEVIDLDLLIQQNTLLGKAMVELKTQREALQAMRQDVSEVRTDLASIKAALPSPKTHTTIRAYSAIHDIKVDARTAQRLGKRAAHLSLQMGKAINHVADDLYGTVNAYLNEIVEKVFTDHFATQEQAQ